MVWHGFVQFIFYLLIIRSPKSSHQGPADWSGWPHDAGEVQDADLCNSWEHAAFFSWGTNGGWLWIHGCYIQWFPIQKWNRNSKRLRFSTEKRILVDQRPAIFWGSGKKLQPRTTSEEASGFGAGPGTCWMILGKPLSWWLLIHMFHNWIVELNIIL